MVDSLMAKDQVNKPFLSTDALFNQFLHDEIKYPGQAWFASIYAHVYVGFDVDEQGLITNITTMSPENVCFGFDQEVKQALRKLYKLKQVYKGSYVLPVAFTYTDSWKRKGPYKPINTLPPERFDTHIVLTELIVPIVVSKPVTASREVWGYYTVSFQQILKIQYLAPRLLM